LLSAPARSSEAEPSIAFVARSTAIPSPQNGYYFSPATERVNAPRANFARPLLAHAVKNGISCMTSLELAGAATADLELVNKINDYCRSNRLMLAYG
jgi:hypothetical protein